ncbi:MULTISPECIES: hypothetical protein [Niastella]|uniref:hypothetical protein n=1 Tax=Niastella TaxID=354354 RepID=UPI001ADA53BB|nr:hypothetical protein [Niastella soli]
MGRQLQAANIRQYTSEANGKRQTADGKRQTANGKRQTANGRRQTINNYLYSYISPNANIYYEFKAF